MRRSMLGVAAFATAALVGSGCISVSPIAPSTVLPTRQSTQTAEPTLSLPPEATLAAPSSGDLMPDPPSGLSSAPPSASAAHADVTITVIFGSGPDAGTKTASGDPGCAYGVMDPGTWSLSYGDLFSGPSDLSAVQVTDEPDSSGKTPSHIFSAFISVGPPVGGARHYALSWDRFNGDENAFQLADNGTSAVIHFVGTSLQSPMMVGGVNIDLTVSCPTVNRDYLQSGP